MEWVLEIIYFRTITFVLEGTQVFLQLLNMFCLCLFRREEKVEQLLIDLAEAAYLKVVFEANQPSGA